MNDNKAEAIKKKYQKIVDDDYPQWEAFLPHLPYDGCYLLDKERVFQKKSIGDLDYTGNPCVLTKYGLCPTPDHLGGRTIERGGCYNDVVHDFFTNCPSTIAAVNFVTALIEMGLLHPLNKKDHFNGQGANGRGKCPIPKADVDKEKKRRIALGLKLGRCWRCPPIAKLEADLRAKQLTPFHKCAIALGVLPISMNVSGINPSKNGSTHLTSQMKDVTVLSIENILHVQFFESGEDGREWDQVHEISDALAFLCGELSQALGITFDETFADKFISISNLSNNSGKFSTSIRNSLRHLGKVLAEHLDDKWLTNLPSDFELSEKMFPEESIVHYKKALARYGNNKVSLLKRIVDARQVPTGLSQNNTQDQIDLRRNILEQFKEVIDIEHTSIEQFLLLARAVSDQIMSSNGGTRPKSISFIDHRKKESDIPSDSAMLTFYKSVTNKSSVIGIALVVKPPESKEIVQPILGAIFDLLLESEQARKRFDYDRVLTTNSKSKRVYQVHLVYVILERVLVGEKLTPFPKSLKWWKCPSPSCTEYILRDIETKTKQYTCPKCNKTYQKVSKMPLTKSWMKSKSKLI